MFQHVKIKIILSEIKSKYLKERGNVMGIGDYLDLKQKMREIEIFLKGTLQ